MSSLLKPLRLGEEASAGYSWKPKTAQPFATTFVHDRCIEAPSELLLSSSTEGKRDTLVNDRCTAVPNFLCDGNACSVRLDCY